jgi:hypothetical protein
MVSRFVCVNDCAERGVKLIEDFNLTTIEETQKQYLLHMGVNHGGTNPPQNLQWGDANTGCPPRFLSYFKISSARHGFVPPPQISTQIYATASSSRGGPSQKLSQV